MARIKARLAGNSLHPCQEPQRRDVPYLLSPTDCFFKEVPSCVRLQAALSKLAASAHTAAEADIFGCRVSNYGMPENTPCNKSRSIKTGHNIQKISALIQHTTALTRD